jgi:hypothetical protein
MSYEFFGGFTPLPNIMLEYLLCCRLPTGSIQLVLLVHRFSFGMHKKSAYLTGAELKQILPVNKARLPRLIKWLIEMNVLKGGAARISKNKKIYAYELSVNMMYQTWNASYNSRKRKIIHNKIDQMSFKNEPYTQTGLDKPVNRT